MIRTVRLLPHQAEIYCDKKTPILGLVAGYGSGKTYCVCRKAMDLLLSNPGKDGIITEPNHPLLIQILYPEMKEALEQFGIDYTFNSKDQIFYCIVDGKETRVICKSMDNFTKLIGVNAAWVICDEFDTSKKEVCMSAYEKLLGRLRGSDNPQFVIASTPEGFNGMYEIFVKNADKTKRLVRAKSTDNPYLPQSYIDLLRDQYSSNLIDAYMNGEFVNLHSGNVYNCFDRTMNDTDREDDGASDLHIGIDFNVTAMSAVICLIKDQKAFCIDEIIGSYDTPDLIQTIREKYYERKIFCYPDSAGNARKSVDANQTDIKLLRAAGFTVRTDTRNPTIKDRVNNVNTMFKNSRLDRRLFVNVSKCPSLTEALEQQAYDPNTHKPDKTSGYDNKGIDALGYFISYMFPIRATSRDRRDVLSSSRGFASELSKMESSIYD